jgi:hypothetical protein
MTMLMYDMATGILKHEFVADQAERQLLGILRFLYKFVSS